MNSSLTNLVGHRFGPFKVIRDTRKAFLEPVAVVATCCGRITEKKTVTALNVARWRNVKRCLECLRDDWKLFTKNERVAVAGAARHGCIAKWTGPAGARLMLDHVGPRPSDRHRLSVRDVSKPHGPTNSAWMLDWEIRVARGTLSEAHTADGTSTTQAGASRALGITREGVRQRRLRGWTLDEATQTPKDQVPPRIQALRSAAAKAKAAARDVAASTPQKKRKTCRR
jgi:hypothetical protein